MVSVKVGAFTDRVMFAVALIDPDVPVIVTVALPTVALALATIVICALEPELTGFGVKNAVTPLGKPLTENVTFPVKPFCGEM